MKMVKVSIIVLNFNQYELTINCIKSLFKQSFNDFEIILIDNFSQDGSYERFIETFEKDSRVKIHQTLKNLGYTGGNNFGVKQCLGEYIAILNNDTIVDKDWLYWLVKGLESNEKIKIVGSEMYTVGNKREVDYSKENVTKTLTGYTVFYKVKDYKKSNFVESFSAGGCSFIYDKSIIDFPFPEEYFAYAEDSHFNWLVQLKGYKVVKAIKSTGDHFHNAVRKNSDKKFNSYLVYLSERNNYINLFVFYNFLNTFKIFPLMVLKALLNNFYYPKNSLSYLKAYVWILVNPVYIFKKRRNIQSQRKVKDEELIKRMSYKIYDESKIPRYKNILKLVNKMSYLHCKIFRIKTVEMF